MMQLRQLPFTELKIDRFFVDDAPTSKDSALIVKAPSTSPMASA